MAMMEITQVELDARDRSGRTPPLHLAARSGHLAVVQYLHGQGVDKEAMGEVGDTPLHNAAINGDEDEDEGGWQDALLWAVHIGHLIVVQYLLGRGLAWRRGVCMTGHLCTWQQRMVTALSCSIWADKNGMRGVLMTGHHCTMQQPVATSLWCSTSKGWRGGMMGFAPLHTALRSSRWTPL